MSINLGIRDIHNEALTRFIYGFLSTTPHPEHFLFEILENEDVAEYETLLRFIDNIHRLGAKISIDDFGSGYSNLLHMANIPADFLKIDGSIIRNCCVNEDSASIIALITTFKSLASHNIGIVAEYVENDKSA